MRKDDAEPARQGSVQVGGDDDFRREAKGGFREEKEEWTERTEKGTHDKGPPSAFERIAL